MVTGDKWRRIGVDGGQQLGRCLSFLVTGATEEEEEKEEEEEGGGGGEVSSVIKS